MFVSFLKRKVLIYQRCLYERYLYQSLLSYRKEEITAITQQQILLYDETRQQNKIKYELLLVEPRGEGLGLG